MKSVIRIRLYERGIIFTLVTKFPAKNGESTPLKNIASGPQTASHQDKKEVSCRGKLQNRKWKRRKNKSSTRASNKHTDKKIKDSSDVKLGQPKLKKKPQSQVRRDRARRRRYWKRMNFARQLSAENLAEHYKRLEAETVASTQVRVVSQPGTPAAWIVHLMFHSHTSCKKQRR